MPMLVYGDVRHAPERYVPPVGEPLEPDVMGRAATRAVRLLGPALVLAVFTLGVLVVAPHLIGHTLTLYAFYTAPFGMEAAIPFALGKGVPALYLATLMVLWDLAYSLTLLLNFEGLKKLPWIGKGFTKAQTRGVALYQRHPWLQRAGLAGLSLFVFLPLAGTGSATGALVGKMTGMSTLKTLLAVVAGTVVRAALLVGVAAGALSLF